MIRVIIFDFDGVIAESNNVKTEAFVKLFADYPEEVRGAVKRFHLENGGMSRFEKFRYIYANFLKEALSEKKFNELCIGFNRLVLDGVVNSPMADGVEEFLLRNRDKYDMYIVSGTPQDEIKTIVERRMLDKYFSGVYGSPETKKRLIQLILRENNYNPEEAVYLGDSINDYEGAEAAGVEFVAKIPDGLDFDPFPNVKLKTRIRKIEEFEEFLDEKNKK